MSSPPSDTPPGWKRALPGALFALLVVAVYADPLFLRRNFGGRDLVAYNLPMERTVHDSYSRGRLPVWSPEVSGGRPLLPNPNAGALYPIRPVLSLVPFPLAMRLFPILHWILGGLGLMVLARSIGISRAGSWLGGVSYSFSGVVVSTVFLPFHPGVALLPWIVWAVARSAANRRGSLLLLSSLFGLAFLGGDPFTVGTAVLAGCLWILLEERRAEWLRNLASLFLALLLGALLALPQIFATILWVPETTRAILGLKLRDTLLFSISPFRLLEFVVPFPFGSTFTIEDARVWGWTVFHGRPAGLFATLYVGALAVVGLAGGGGRARGLTFARVLLGLALLMSVPPSLAPAAWGDARSPIALRNPEKFAVAMTFALALLAALGADRFRRRRVPGWTLGVGIGLALFSAASALFPQAAGAAAVRLIGEDVRLSERAGTLLAPSLAEAGLLWCATLVALDLSRAPGRAATAASLLLLTLVPIAANRRIARTYREEELFAPTPFARLLQRRDPPGAWRTLGESVYQGPSAFERWITRWDPMYVELPRRNWSEHTQALWERGTVFNYDFDVGDLSRLHTLRRVSQLAARHSRGEIFFASLAMRWGIRFRDQRPLPGYRRFGGDMLQDWDENASALPDIRLAKRWRETPGGVPALNAIGRLEPDEIVVETGASRSGSGPGGGVRVLEKLPERMVLETRAPQPTWLFVLRGYWEHRRIRLDGREVAARPAQLAFSALAVPSGVHRVEWQELLPGGNLSRWGPVLFGLFAMLLRSRGRL